ncbi:MAG TPA: PAS domain-containing protein, partial [Myxococcota bacterium]|nr:PAS domain-containing protein [Myxococcota bacterium]
MGSASECRARCRAERVDLIVAESALGAECAELLEAFRVEGPPVVVVQRNASERAALEAFRRGAADCVVAGDEFADVLPVVALEQIQRWRAARDQGVAERRIRDLERYNQNIIQNLNSALLVIDLGGRIAFSNPPAEEILGEGAESLRGRAIAEWFVGLPRDQDPVARTLETGERCKGVETSLRRAA